MIGQFSLNGIGCQTQVVRWSVRVPIVGFVYGVDNKTSLLPGIIEMFRPFINVKIIQFQREL